MPSKLELICAGLRRSAADADAMAQTAAQYVRQLENTARQTAALAGRRPRVPELVSRLEAVARQLRRDVVGPLTVAARRNREIAAQLCGGGAAAVSIGSAGWPGGARPASALRMVGTAVSPTGRCRQLASRSRTSRANGSTRCWTAA